MSERVRLRAGDTALDLVPEVGGSVARFSVETAGGSVPLFRQAPVAYDDVLEAGCFPLVPYSNRIRDGRFVFRGREVRLSPNLPSQKHPLHGQGWRGAWTVADAGDRRAELRFRHEPGEWPWAYESRQVFELDERGLSYRLTLTNASDEPMPSGLALHPYFPSDGQTILDTQVEQVWTIDEEVMPVALEPATGRYDLNRRGVNGIDLDNGYEGWSGRARIEWPNRGAALTMSAEAPRFQLYSPPEGGLFCAEPVTNANDAFSRPETEWEALGVTILEPGQESELRVRFEVERFG